ncbi:MAG: B12-binding domain-containing protein [Chloroflexota bacterium]|nr:MAG: B12-binding domain-containing protein [Chloroflexota bacterium]
MEISRTGPTVIIGERINPTNRKKVMEAMLEGNFDIARQDALSDGLDAQVVLNDGLLPGIDFVSVEFRAGNMYVPEVLRSARAMQASMDVLRPLLAQLAAERSFAS